MTTKLVFDESAHALHRVVGYAHAWEQLAPGIRVRRRVVGPLRLEEDDLGVASWVATFNAELGGPVPRR